MNIHAKIWLDAWNSVARSDNSNLITTPSKWADVCLEDFRERFPHTSDPHVPSPIHDQQLEVLKHDHDLLRREVVRLHGELVKSENWPIQALQENNTLRATTSHLNQKIDTLEAQSKGCPRHDGLEDVPCTCFPKPVCNLTVDECHRENGEPCSAHASNNTATCEKCGLVFEEKDLDWQSKMTMHILTTQHNTFKLSAPMKVITMYFSLHHSE